MIVALRRQIGCSGIEPEAPPLAAEAASAAIEQSGISPQQVTHLVTVSCSGFSAPGFDLLLIEQLGLRSRSPHSRGVHGLSWMLNGLRVAHAFAAADPNAGDPRAALGTLHAAPSVRLGPAKNCRQLARSPTVPQP
ncbi:MAG UNVERIFIED_CONTAM: hypothetical protein LVR18_45395 [Planctomycetaceae bacterium]|jgi:hypothetical protein